VLACGVISRLDGIHFRHVFAVFGFAIAAASRLVIDAGVGVDPHDGVAGRRRRHLGGTGLRLRRQRSSARSEQDPSQEYQTQFWSGTQNVASVAAKEWAHSMGRIMAKAERSVKWKGRTGEPRTIDVSRRQPALGGLRRTRRDCVGPGQGQTRAPGAREPTRD